MMILADIAHGEVDAADVLFLIAFIVGVVSVLLHAFSTAEHIAAALVGAAVALIALAFLLL